MDDAQIAHDIDRDYEAVLDIVREAGCIHKPPTDFTGVSPHSLSPKRMILVSKFINSAKTNFKSRALSARR